MIDFHEYRNPPKARDCYLFVLSTLFFISIRIKRIHTQTIVCTFVASISRAEHFHFLSRISYRTRYVSYLLISFRYILPTLQHRIKYFSQSSRRTDCKLFFRAIRAILRLWDRFRSESRKQSRNFPRSQIRF